ncbi:MAG: Ribosomal protein S12p Asp88 (E. coli) methylthiotransferase [uncultured Campylobacterales bacterium]|uniref:Ribosomal protein uS12 methylthiotransferase RimO n=1 Tax=uncultured Campylobacterales bacterium TaxID=352960 RepID=A0A6S6TEA9_9BACT|nr:MAG: Ribosomal protein S12p Asp88 (E. coli) methylthiotransferase [uncultured Campylobacterales bacterium]
MSKKLYLRSLGCTKNLVDSEVMLGQLSDHEIVQSPVNADVIILNTCGFIGAAKKESLEAIFEIHENRSEDSIFVVSGCLTQRYQKELAGELPEVDIFTGVGDYGRIRDLIDKKQNIFSPATFLIQNEERVVSNSNYHAYIKLSEGCNQQCSFCAIPGFKGKLNSRDLETITSEVKRLVARGFFDFTFISQDSSSFLRDKKNKEGLISLIDAIEDIAGVKSARIFYLYPTTTSNELIEHIAKSKVFHNYFDMPIQHISSSLLKNMKRGAGTSRIKEQLSLMRATPNSFLRSTFIVGHPGESEEDFEELVAFMDEFDFDRVNVFAYSDEEGTPAFNYQNKVDEDTINSRIDKLNEVIKRKYLANLESYKNKTIDIVIDGESSEGEFFFGAKALNWAPDIDGEILINESDVKDLKMGQIYKANISDIAGDKLLAKVIS